MFAKAPLSTSIQKNLNILIGPFKQSAVCGRYESELLNTYYTNLPRYFRIVFRSVFALFSLRYNAANCKNRAL